MPVESPFELAPRGIHVWPLRIEAPDEVAVLYERVLVAEELNRAARLRFRTLRRSFVVTRGMLRVLLGRYLNQHPASIRFAYGLNGKPKITSSAGIQFNLAHSHSMAVVAITSHCPIGVDLEHIRPMPDMRDVAKHFLCAAEAAELMSLLPSERERAFFRCWTRKEAYLKALGDGLSAPLDGCRVTVQPNQPARFVHLGHDRVAAETWALHDLLLPADYAAALAYRDCARSLTVFPIVSGTELLGAI
jgi:4'-phosphopantetheinyl transferase